MLGKINPAQIQKVMKSMGISQTPIDAKRVIIELEDSNLVIDDPTVTKVMMQGKETYQVDGTAREESREVEKFSEEDVQMVMEKTGAKEAKVREVLEENGGDIAGAILELK